jgi:L-seryl-tRNA(Ser) seleniumtransferase
MNTDDRRAALRAIPSVSTLLLAHAIAEAAVGIEPSIVASVARQHQERVRREILAGRLPDTSALEQHICDDLASIAGRTSRLVINGTGVIIQTNLGRAPVSSATAAAMAAAATSYLALETDLSTGERGGRGSAVESLMRALTGAERTLVVNNNAAAVMLTLAALALDREVIVSRSEAVEIGGGFRVPDVLRQSGARLVEVGTTNRTYVSDYASAIGDQTGALLRVHASNFSIIGFTAKPELHELANLARDRGIVLIEDVGSGCLLDTRDFGLDHEPTLQESIAAGVDVVCASGDKLLGGPQAGLILGRAEVVARIARHPLARALRADKTCLAGIAETLRHYARGEAVEQLPVWWSMSRDAGWLRSRCMGWANAIGSAASVQPSLAVVGGGSLPGKTLPSFSLAITPGASGSDALARRLRTGSPHVVPRVVDGLVTIDARTVLPAEDAALLDAIRAAVADS